MKKTVLLVIIVLVFACSTASAFIIKLTNTANQMTNYNIIWLECDWPGFPAVMSMARGEIHPGQEKVFDNNSWKPGRWGISWDRMGISYPITIPADNGTVIATPEKPPVFIPGN